MKFEFYDDGSIDIEIRWDENNELINPMAELWSAEYES